MNLNFYHYVAVIAEDGNLSTASEHLFITQSALTQALKKMEQAFGGPLFTYQNRSMRPTPLGQIVLETAMEMEEARLQMTNAISQPETAAAGILLLHRENRPLVYRRLPTCVTTMSGV